MARCRDNPAPWVIVGACLCTVLCLRATEVFTLSQGPDAHAATRCDVDGKSLLSSYRHPQAITRPPAAADPGQPLCTPLRESQTSAWAQLLLGTLLGLLVAATGAATPALADAAGRWNYDLKGDDWGRKFPDCNGRNQTPIDIKKEIISTKGDDTLAPLIKYRPTDTEIYNNSGKTVQANGSFGSLTLPDGEYEVKQFHFHFPSEHTIDGRLLAGEMHIVHQKVGADGANDLAVIGIMLDEQGDVVFGKEGVLLSNLGFGTDLPDVDGKQPVAALNLMAFINEFKGGFWHYKGSLTTPPCNETVHWYVLKRYAKITRGMTNTFRNKFPEDNRRVQLLNKRKLIDSDLQLPGEFIENWPFDRV